jgi:hypothetical protein
VDGEPLKGHIDNGNGSPLWGLRGGENDQPNEPPPTEEQPPTEKPLPPLSANPTPTVPKFGKRTPKMDPGKGTGSAPLKGGVLVDRVGTCEIFVNGHQDKFLLMVDHNQGYSDEYNTVELKGDNHYVVGVTTSYQKGSSSLIVKLYWTINPVTHEPVSHDTYIIVPVHSTVSTPGFGSRIRF